MVGSRRFRRIAFVAPDRGRSIGSMNCIDHAWMCGAGSVIAYPDASHKHIEDDGLLSRERTRLNLREEDL